MKGKPAVVTLVSRGPAGDRSRDARRIEPDVNWRFDKMIFQVGAGSLVRDTFCTLRQTREPDESAGVWNVTVFCPIRLRRHPKPVFNCIRKDERQTGMHPVSTAWFFRKGIREKERTWNSPFFLDERRPGKSLRPFWMERAEVSGKTSGGLCRNLRSSQANQPASRRMYMQVVTICRIY